MSKITLKRTNSADPDFQMLIRELDADLRLRNGDLMDIYDSYNVIEPIDTVVIAYMDEIPAGCGCFKSWDQDTAEVKRMFVRPVARGKGVSSKVLQELEDFAVSSGFSAVVLETGSKQNEALALYNKKGYLPVAQYEPYIGLPDSICFRKNL